VPAAGSLFCTYSADLPDASARTNTATATQQLYDFAYDMTATADGTMDYSGSAAVDFSGADITHVDEEITVTDDYGTPGDTSDDVALGTVNALTDLLPKTLTYNRTFTVDDFPYCGDHSVVNTAKFVTNDTGTFGVDSWTILFHIPCDEGCTPGFWQGGNGSALWNQENDPHFVPKFGNPFYHDTLFNDFFSGSATYPELTDPELDGLTMLQAVSGSGDYWPRKVARDVVAAYLNAAHAEINYPYGTTWIEDEWYSALYAFLESDGVDDDALETLHGLLDTANNLGCDMN
jgi:hypothetical protein